MSNSQFTLDKETVEEIIIKNMFLLGEHQKFKYGVLIVNARFYNSTMNEENIFKKLIDIFTQALNISEKLYQKKQIIVLSNMERITFNNINSSFLKKMVKILQDTYPERLYKCYIQKPPFIFNYIYKIIRPFLDKRTTSKIKIVKYKNNEFQYDENETIDIDNINNKKYKLNNYENNLIEEISL